MNTEPDFWFHVGEVFYPNGVLGGDLPENFPNELFRQAKEFFQQVIGDGKWIQPPFANAHHFARKFPKHAEGIQGFSVIDTNHLGENIARIVVMHLNSGSLVGLHVDVTAFMQSRRLGCFCQAPPFFATA